MSTETSEETIRRVLSGYEIGAKLRRLRLKKKLSLRDLGKRIGLSASMLSQIESGKLIPVLPTLTHVAEVFGVDLRYFFDESSNRTFSITRGNELISFPEPDAGAQPMYHFGVCAFGATEKVVLPYLAQFPKGCPKDANEHAHQGFEFLYILEGSLLVIHDREEHVLNKGDAAVFDSFALHGYCGLSDETAKALVITSPQIVK